MERVYSTGGLNATDGKNILNVIASNITTLGWTVVDDQITASSYVVVYSDGHSKSNNRLPCYIRFKHSTIYIQTQVFIYWNTTTHVGWGMVGPNVPSATPASTDFGGLCDQSTYNTVSLRGNKDFLNITITRPTTTVSYVTDILRIDNPTWDYVGAWQATTYAGTDIVATLNSGAASQLKIGGVYRIVSPEGHVTKATITNKSVGSNTVTLNSLPYTLVSGTRIGSIPFPWVTIGEISAVSTKYGLSWAQADAYTSSASVGAAIVSNRALQAQTLTKDFHNNGGDISLFPYLFYETGYGSFGTSSYLQYCNTNPINYGDIMGINSLDSGTVSSATTTQLTDSSKAWVVNVFTDMSVIITSGAQQEVLRNIVSNTADTLTVSPAYSPTISGGVTFTICEAFYTLTNRPETFLAMKVI